MNNPLMEEKTVRVLVVDDELPIRRFLKISLGGQYTVLEAASGLEALAVTVTGRPDAVILDLGLPDVDGIEVTRQLREWTQIPIIVITVRNQEADKVDAFEAGADDYLTKPFSVAELMARLRVALRHSLSPGQEPVYEGAGLVADFARRIVAVNGETVSLTPTEYEILRVLIQHAGKVLTHQQLVHAVWNDNYEADAHLLRVNISNLRKKLEANPTRPKFIVTEPGVGYRLKTP